MQSRKGNPNVQHAIRKKTTKNPKHITNSAL